MRRKIFLVILVILEHSISTFVTTKLLSIVYVLEQNGVTIKGLPLPCSSLLWILSILTTIVNIIMCIMVMLGKEDSK